MALQQDPNGPPVDACEVVATVLKTEAKLIKLGQDVQDTIETVQDILWKIAYRVIDIADVAGAELVAGISIVSGAIVSSITQAVSGALSSVLEAVFAALLEILLAFPDAIFSLVAIPLERARDTAARERDYLNKAKQSLDAAMAIIDQSVKGIDGSRFYRQMSSAMPSIEQALILMSQMISDLNGLMDDRGDTVNSKFDQGKYNTIRGLIKSAINATKPTPFIDAGTQYAKSITNKWENEKKTKISEIEEEYKIKKADIDRDYKKKVTMQLLNIDLSPASEQNQQAIDLVAGQLNATAGSVGSVPGNLANAIIAEKLNLEWSQALSNLEVDKKAQISNVSLQMDYTQAFSLQEAKNAAASAAEKFMAQMDLLGKYLLSFVENAGSAYLQHKLCQNYSHTVYGIRGFIKELIKYIIIALRGIGNGSAMIAVGALEGSKNMVTVTKDMFSESMKAYENHASNKEIGGARTSAAVMSGTVSAGNVLLETSDALLAGLITDSLIKLINADDALESDAEAFNEFLKRLISIPDWDGTLAVWAPSPFSGTAPNPYIQLIADASYMVSQVPILSFSMKDADKEAIAEAVSNTDKSMAALTNHNANVMSVLSSYTPYQSEAGGRLKNILANAGLLDAFAVGLSAAGLVQSLLETQIPDWEKMVPNVINCNNSYPSLFEGQDERVAAAHKKANEASVVADTIAQRSHQKAGMSSWIRRTSSQSLSAKFAGTNHRYTKKNVPFGSTLGVKPKE